MSKCCFLATYSCQTDLPNDRSISWNKLAGNFHSASGSNRSRDLFWTRKREDLTYSFGGLLKADELWDLYKKDLFVADWLPVFLRSVLTSRALESGSFLSFTFELWVLNMYPGVLFNLFADVLQTLYFLVRVVVRLLSMEYVDLESLLLTPEPFLGIYFWLRYTYEEGSGPRRFKEARLVYSCPLRHGCSSRTLSIRCMLLLNSRSWIPRLLPFPAYSLFLCLALVNTLPLPPLRDESILNIKYKLYSYIFRKVFDSLLWRHSNSHCPTKLSTLSIKTLLKMNRYALWASHI